MSALYRNGWLHCRARAMLRVGYELGMIEYMDLCNRCANQSQAYIGKANNGRTKYQLNLGGKDCIGIFDGRTKTIRTILTKEM